MSEPLSVKDRIKQAHRPRRPHKINLRGDLVAKHEIANNELTDLLNREEASTAQPRLGGVTTTASMEKAAQVKAIEAEMADWWLELVLEARPWHEWAEFKSANPPRDDDQIDRTAGVNFDALIQNFMPRCVVEPALDDEDWENIFARCAPGDLRDLGGTAFGLHERSLDIPKSPMASVVMARHVDASAPHGSGESQSDGSTDGSPSSSTSTTRPMKTVKAS